MKVILIEDVKSLGKKGDLVNVSDGYARNYLISKKLGVEANTKNMNELKQRQESEAKKAKEAYEEAVALGARLDSIEADVKIKAGEGGRLFGSVSSKEIAQAVLEQHGIEIDKKKIVLPQPIKNLGTVTVSVKLHPKVTAQLKVNVKEE